jgi:hypothetical protein
MDSFAVETTYYFLLIAFLDWDIAINIFLHYKMTVFSIMCINIFFISSNLNCIWTVEIFQDVFGIRFLVSDIFQDIF